LRKSVFIDVFLKINCIYLHRTHRRPSVDKQACINVCLSTLFSRAFNDDQKHCTHGHSKATEASFIT